MKQLQRIAFIGNHLPRRCGIATFTHDLHRAIATARPDLDTTVVAMTDRGQTYDYPKAVGFQINDQTIDDYVRAAAFLNEARFDVVSLQHEFGIFSGPAGANIIELLSRLTMPVVSTFHTVLPKPSPEQHDVMRRIADISAKTIVMAEKGREFLRSVYDVPDRKIDVIPHGIPDFPFIDSHHAKMKFGFADKMIILTFGLLSPSKGIEIVINAMPEIIKSCPNAVYVILGATHPNLLRDKGEAYRESLAARVQELGIEDHVVFLNQFVDQTTLLEYISMCDVYVTPYLNEAQMTSGTLAYSFGLGKPVVSTPYWHARELLREGRGILVPFGDSAAIGTEIAELLSNDVRRRSIRNRAYATSRSMTWAQTARRYLAVFEEANKRTQLETAPSNEPSISINRKATIPELRVEHFLSLCDTTGMLQHATHSVANRDHGYCVDDNARALLFSCALTAAGEQKLPGEINSRFAAFIEHAWNPDTQRFRNFMSYDRRWLEDHGSEDSHGRTLWALGECARSDSDPSRRRWAASLFEKALPVVEGFSSLRSWTFALLGLEAYCAEPGYNLAARRMRKLLAERLMVALAASEADDWVWFESVLAYDNARLPQALIVTGLSTATPAYVAAGLRSLRWLMSLQTTELGHFRPVGTGSFGQPRRKPEPFDQQPIEAAATIAACIAAWRANGAAEWSAGAMRAYAWFLGENDLRLPLIDPNTGACSDGLHPDRKNENKGAESALSYLLGVVDISQFKRTVAMSRIHPVSKLVRAGQASAPQTTTESFVDSIPAFDPAEPVSASRPSPSRRQAVQARDGAA